MYYRPKNAVSGDVIPYYENGTFYLFYLKDYRDAEKHGEGCPWHLVTTTDFVHFTEHGEVLPRGTGDEQDMYVFTGSVFKHESTYYIFYTGHNPSFVQKGKPQEKVLLAASKDLLHWEKQPDFVFSAPDFLEPHDFRDPFIYRDEERKKFCMLLAARKTQGPVNKRGCTAIAVSDDLLHWEMEREPFYAPDNFFTHECPDLFKMGEFYYLLFSEFTDKVVTRYRMAKSLSGPWRTPLVDSFDGHCFYAAKSAASEDGKRYLFGWNCIRDKERDYEPWQWGGTIITHELVQKPDGTLAVKCPETVSAAYSERVKMTPRQPLGDVRAMGSGYVLNAAGKEASVIVGEMPQNCKMTVRFSDYPKTSDFGLLLRCGQGQNEYYTVKFEPKYNRMCFDRMPRRYGEQHCMIESERYCDFSKPLTVTAIAEGSVLEVYVNDETAMSARMFDFQEGGFGLYAADGRVTADDVAIFSNKEEK